MSLVILVIFAPPYLFKVSYMSTYTGRIHVVLLPTTHTRWGIHNVLLLSTISLRIMRMRDVLLLQMCW